MHRKNEYRNEKNELHRTDGPAVTVRHYVHILQVLILAVRHVSLSDN